MAVIGECISVITRLSTIDTKFPGGLTNFRSCVPNQTYCNDGSLVRVGFMTPADASVWTRYLEDSGLIFIRKIDGEYCAIEIVVVDQVDGPTCKCDWIESEIIGDNRWVWLAGDLPGELVTPLCWQPGNPGDLKKVLQADFEALPISRSGNLDITLDSDTAAPRYTGRAFGHQHDFDVLIRQARTEFQLEHYDAAYAFFLKAEEIQPLIDSDRIEAALSASGVLLSLESREICTDAIRRWTEITEISPGKDNANYWAERAAVEMRNLLIVEGMRSADRSVEIDATNRIAVLKTSTLVSREGEHNFTFF